MKPFLFLLILFQSWSIFPCSILSIGNYFRFWSSSNQSDGNLALSVEENPTPRELNKKIAITFVNGIYHSAEECKNLSNLLESSFGVKVYPFYNPSTGSWVKDFSKASFDLVLRSNDIILAKNLTEHFRNVLNTLEPKGRLLHLAHSGGAILTYLAAKHHLTLGEANRIDVITFGGGKSITRKYFNGGRVCNYYSRNDPLALIDRRTSILLRLYEEYYEMENETFGIIQEQKHNTTFIFLSARANHPIIDHSMFGPTYQYAVELEAQYLRERIQKLVLHERKERSVIRKWRKKFANITRMHHFWDRNAEVLYYNYTYQDLFPSWKEMVRTIRKQAANITSLHGAFSGKYRNSTNLPTESAFIVDEANLLDIKQESNTTDTIFISTTGSKVQLLESPQETSPTSEELSFIQEFDRSISETRAPVEEPQNNSLDINYLSFSE